MSRAADPRSGVARIPPLVRLEPLIPNERWGAVEDVAARLSLAVDLELLAPGERLPAGEELASAFDVSEMTITRALRTLVGEGVVVRQRGRGGGTFVAPRASRRRTTASSRRGAYKQAAREVADLLDHRRVLEAGIAFAAAQRATPAAVRRLRGLVQVMDEATSWVDMGIVDPRFHLEIADIAGSAGARQALTAVLARAMRFYQPPGDADEWRTFNDDHRDLVAAIAAGRADEAGRIAEWHVRRIAGVVRE